MSDDTQMNDEETALIQAAITAIDSTPGPPLSMVIGNVNEGQMSLLCVAMLVPAFAEDRAKQVFIEAVLKLTEEMNEIDGPEAH